MTIDRSGTMYFVEAGIGSGTGLARGDYKVWKVSAAGVLTTLAGNGTPSYSGDGGPATAAQFNGPAGVAVAASGVMYIADTQNQRVRALAPGGKIDTVAGTGVGGIQWRDRIAAHRAAELSAGSGGRRAGQLVRGGHSRITACARCSRAATCSPSRATETRAISAMAGKGRRPA